MSLVLATVMLANCSYFETQEAVLESEPPMEAEEETVQFMTVEPVEPMNLQQIANSVSDGSVEVYGF